MLLRPFKIYQVIFLGIVACTKTPTSLPQEDVVGLLARVQIQARGPAASCTPSTISWHPMTEKSLAQLKLRGPCRYSVRVDIGTPGGDGKSLVDLKFSSEHPRQKPADLNIQGTRQLEEIVVYPVRSAGEQPPRQVQPFRPSFEDSSQTVYDEGVGSERGQKFYAQLKPAFDRSCIPCHHPKGVASTLRLDRYPFAGVFLKDEKLILRSIVDHVSTQPPDMPPPGTFPLLESTEIAILKEWQP